MLRSTRALESNSSKFSLKKLLTSSQKTVPPAKKDLHVKPAAGGAAARSPSPQPPATPPPAVEWTAHVTEEGHTFYASAVTGATQWEAPETLVVGQAHGSEWNENPLTAKI